MCVAAIMICHRCPYRGQPSGGACPCTIDGRDIIQHAEARQCPQGRYPHDMACESPPPPEPPPPPGVGTELKALLKRRGIIPVAGCSCNAHAREMDARGPAWCAANIPAIVAWMKVEAEKQNRIFSLKTARFLVNKAIAAAKRKGIK